MKVETKAQRLKNSSTKACEYVCERICVICAVYIRQWVVHMIDTYCNAPCSTRLPNYRVRICGVSPSQHNAVAGTVKTVQKAVHMKTTSSSELVLKIVELGAEKLSKHILQMQRSGEKQTVFRSLPHITAKRRV